MLDFPISLEEARDLFRSRGDKPVGSPSSCPLMYAITCLCPDMGVVKISRNSFNLGTRRSSSPLPVDIHLFTSTIDRKISWFEMWDGVTGNMAADVADRILAGDF